MEFAQPTHQGNGQRANRLTMSHLLDFYRLQKPDSEGRLLSDLWTWSDDQLEQCHDFIQWVFPLAEPSSVNPDAPLVTGADRQAFRSDEHLRSNMRRSLSVFLRFLGLETNGNAQVTRPSNFANRSAIWRHPNHNWLRVTRLLKSLRLLGFDKEAAAVWACLKELHENDGLVMEDSFSYWREAAGG